MARKSLHLSQSNRFKDFLKDQMQRDFQDIATADPQSDSPDGKLVASMPLHRVSKDADTVSTMMRFIKQYREGQKDRREVLQHKELPQGH